jgi:hypothetical protein
VGSQIAVPGHEAGDVRAVLRPPASAADRAGQLVELALWAGAVVAVAVDRRRRRAAGPATADPAWFVREVTHRTRDRRPPAQPARPSGPAFADDEEVWSGA